MKTPKRLLPLIALLPHCAQCGDWYGLNQHHKRLRCAGGDNSPDNLMVLCRNCHVAHHKAENHYRNGGAVGGTNTMSKPASKARALANLPQFAGWAYEDLLAYCIQRAMSYQAA